MCEKVFTTMTIQEWGIIIAIIISLLSLFLVVYKDYIQNYKLHTSIDQIFIMRVPANNKINLLLDMLLDDLLSDNPSKEARSILSSNQFIAQLVTTGNREKLKVDLVQFSKSTPIKYDPPDIIIEKYLSDQRFGSSFYIPLIIHNSGKKFAHVSSLIIIMESLADGKKWAFASFVEINQKVILQRSVAQTDQDRISQAFTGFSIGPGKSLRVDPWFIPMQTANDIIISRENILPGEYSLTLFGYDNKNRVILSAERINYKIDLSNIRESFSGTESAQYLHISDNIEDALNK